jgi:CRP/FNR family transcriptional regulator
MSEEKKGHTATLRKTQLFADLSDKELHALAARVVPRHFRKGDLIFSEGQSCEGLYVVESGGVKIFKTSPGGREQVLTVEGPGNSVAELPVFDGGNYPASASALGNTGLLFVSKDDFRAICVQHPYVALKVLKVAGARLRKLVGLIEEISFTTVRHRLVAVLVRLAKRRGKPSERGIEFPLMGSNEDLASHIGTVRELVSRNLGRLQAEGAIRLEGKNVIIPDLKNLEAMLEGEE